MCATGKTGHVDNCPFQPKASTSTGAFVFIFFHSFNGPLLVITPIAAGHLSQAPRTAPCGHATHHDAFACRQLAPHPAATDNVSFGPVLRYVFFFFFSFWFCFVHHKCYRAAVAASAS
ncbi:hypothetical protein EDB84DRAFT_562672 [Lactarius hengduanensis]|nr:hypothetical protein EDB84DRAFT_562672 [Lactarius hengduanensis]